MTLARNVAATLTSNVLVRGAGMASLLASRRFLGPEAAGIWNLLQLATGYAMALHSGAILGAEREIPMRRGKGDGAGESRIRSLLFGSAATESVVAACLVLLYAFWFGGRHRPQIATGLYWVAAYIVLWRLSESLLISIRSVQQFVPLARCQSILALTDLAWVVVCTYRGGLNGQIFAFAASLATRIAMYAGMIRRGDWFRFGARFSLRESAPLARIGFPLVLNNLLWQWLVTADSLVVANILGVAALGFYSLGASAGRAAEEVPAAFSAVVYPRMLQDFGAREDRKALGDDLFQYLLMTAFVFAPLMAGGLFFLIPFLVRQALPEFVPAVGAIRLLILSGTLLSLTLIPSNVLVVRGRTILLTMITLAALAGKIALVANRIDGGISAAAGAALAAHGIFLAVVLGSAFAETLGAAAGLGRAAVLLGGLVYAGAAMGAANFLFAPDAAGNVGEDALRSLGAIGFSLLAAAPLLWTAQRRLDLVARLRALVGR